MYFSEEEIEEKVKTELPYMVVWENGGRLSINRRMDAKAWCANRFGDQKSWRMHDDVFQWKDTSIWTIWWFEKDNTYRFAFRDLNDAIEFKLMWG